MTDLAKLMRAAAPVGGQLIPKRNELPAPRPKLAPADMHPAHRANAIAKARREGDTACLAELQAATPKE